jgi:hypothetical protein
MTRLVSTMMTSPDGVNWSVDTNPWDTSGVNFPQGFDIGWNGSLAVAVGNTAGQQIQTSPDLISWTLRASPDPTACFNVAWFASASLWIVTMEAAGGALPPGVCISTSPDGIIWTHRAITGDNQNISGWDILVAGSQVIVSTSDSITYSTDGINWTIGTSLNSGTGQNWVALAWNGSNLYVAMADHSSNSTGFDLWTSTDGRSWTFHSTLTNLDIVFRVLWVSSLSKFVATGGLNFTTGPIVISSSDGLNWTGHSTPFDPQGFGDWLDWSSDQSQFVLVGESDFPAGDKTIMTSPDGSTWTVQNTPIDGSGVSGTPTFLNAVRWIHDKGLWVTVGHGFYSKINKVTSTANSRLFREGIVRV